ncbi:ras guanine nucleotide exchange factor domain-containing protein [Xylaria intraflava]|nr:ras guanine nucleotide exchange factor domain-containing protein [Xylaria intraflava]
MMLDTQIEQSNSQVAPLAITRSRSDSVSVSSQDDMAASASASIYSQSLITPLSTPNHSQEDLVSHQPPLAPPPPPPRPIFHNFLRAFYPFQPACTVTDSTITLPLNEGDVVLVHSIHTNGWADGTQLATGARGWLPTNYCEAYDPEEMRTLLKALLNFWDLLRITVTDDQDIFENQEFMKGIIAGVRYLLDRTHCLTRETPIIQRSDSLRRGRKGLLSELSLLVKTAKRLQGMLRFSATYPDETNDVIDEMILKAFKVVVKGVRFLDLLEEDRHNRAPTITVMATVIEESLAPPTPPIETTNFGLSVENGRNASCGSTDDLPSELRTDAAQSDELTTQRLSSPANTPGNRLSLRNSQTLNRSSANITHRLSFADHSPSAQQNLVSGQLNACHDSFLSHLSSLIGRLRLQSLSRPEFALAIRLSTTSGEALWAVVNVVCDHNTLVPESLETALAAMFDHICDLVSSARDIMRSCGVEAEHVVLPQDDALQHAAIHCVKAAGECVARTKLVLEEIGDFEFEVPETNLGLDLSLFEATPESRPRTPEGVNVIDSKIPPISRTATSIHLSMEKPLPEIPQTTSAVEEAGGMEVSFPSPPQPTVPEINPLISVSSAPLSRPSLPPLPKLSTVILPESSYSPTEMSHDIELHGSFRSDTGTATSFTTNSSYLSRDSESSAVSQTSTRATTPDSTQVPRNQPSLSDLSTTGSTALTEEVEEVETKLLEKTFAHELMFNKDGQVIGGSLPALIERLTTHETTPDAIFVSAFYLTFRLFCTPYKLADALIERFDYVGESPHSAAAVRLRVYNVFKGWLESHWRETTDSEALPLINDFAEFKLVTVIPSASKRLLDLVQRASVESLTPRLAPPIGKPNASKSTPVSPDTTLPPSVFSKSQQGLLANWKTGGNSPSILDFDSLEIARQITLKQMSIFCSIKPEELLGSQWMKHGGARSPNVKAMSGFSNDLSNLVADTILQYSEVKKRAATIKQWIKIANRCLELNNYDALMAIVCSLNSSVISRLRKTWDILSPKRRELFRTLYAIVEPSNNNRVLRARLQGHVPPCLPFLGMFLTDLTFVDIGNPATKQLPGINLNGQGKSVINFDKHSRTAKIIGDLQRFQLPHRIAEVPDLQEWLQAQTVRMKELDQSNVQVTYYRKSLLLEPRETALRTPIEGPTQTTQVGAKADLFGWISRDRHNNNTAVAI